MLYTCLLDLENEGKHNFVHKLNSTVELRFNLVLIKFFPKFCVFHLIYYGFCVF